MPKLVTIKTGDCVINICDREGLSWEKVWNHPENAKLKKLRKDLNILKKGDKLYLPDIQVKQDPAETEKRHSYRLKTGKIKVKLTMLELGKPRAAEDWILRIGGSEIAHGVTDKHGTLEAGIPPGAKTGTLLIGKDRDEVEVRFGHIDPIDEISGIQSRLRNLGFYLGDIDDLLGPLTKAAIAEFQRMAEITGEGKITEETKKKLVDFHGS